MKHLNAQRLSLAETSRHVPIPMGSRFKLLEVISEPFRFNGETNTYYDVLCECGATSLATGSQLRTGRRRSCGCQVRKGGTKTRYSRIHGHRKPWSPTYHTWHDMKKRCYYQKSKGWKDYGARGITVCQRWRESFEAFLADMGERPEGMTIDRIDVNGNYELSNCRWATRAEQERNKRVSQI